MQNKVALNLLLIKSIVLRLTVEWRRTHVKSTVLNLTLVFVSKIAHIV